MSKMVFIVDDSKTVRVSVEYTLTKAGYEVMTADDGQDALNKLAEMQHNGVKPTMMITDVNMPNMDGITFIQEVKKQKEYQFTPILFLTTESQDSKKMEGKKAGAAGWLVKPFSPDQLIEVVKKFVK